MICGTVVETLRTLTRAPALGERPLLAVEAEGTHLAAIDLAGAGQGDRVLLLTGEAALRCCPEAVADAAVVAVTKKAVDKPCQFCYDETVMEKG